MKLDGSQLRLLRVVFGVVGGRHRLRTQFRCMDDLHSARRKLRTRTDLNFTDYILLHMYLFSRLISPAIVTLVSQWGWLSDTWGRDTINGVGQLLRSGETVSSAIKQQKKLLSGGSVSLHDILVKVRNWQQSGRANQNETFHRNASRVVLTEQSPFIITGLD